MRTAFVHIHKLTSIWRGTEHFSLVAAWTLLVGYAANHRFLVNHNRKFIYTNNPIICPLVKDRLWIMKHNSVFYALWLRNRIEVIATSSNVPGSNVN